MSMTGTHYLCGLLHTPYGLEHPYEQGPAERFPRDPEAGQPVTLGVATWPTDAAEVVWAEWTTTGPDEGGTAQGRWVEDDGERSHWRVPLPAFRRGQRVVYHVCARQDDRPLKSEAFSFVVAGWCPVGDVAEVRLASDRLEFQCACDDASLRPRVAVTFPAPHVLQLRLSGAAPCRGGQDVPAGSSPGGQQPHVGVAYRVIEETAESIVVATERLRVTIHRRPCRLEIFTADGTPLLLETEPLEWLVGEDGRPVRVRQAFASPLGEAFYGFGERYNALDQRGNELDVRVFEQYRNQGRRTCFPVPFLLSSQGYGLYLATSRYVAYDLAASRTGRWSFDAQVGPDGVLESTVIAGTPRQAIATLADLTHKPALPPRWAFGPWMSGNEWNSQARVMEQVRQTIEHRIPASVLVIEAWSDESTFYVWNDAQYRPRPADEPLAYRDFAFPPGGRWPDPQGMIQELHDLGIRVLLWQIPVMKKLAEPHAQHDRDEAHAIEKQYCVQEADGQPYRIRPFWFHGGLVLDFTNLAAVRWWLSKRAYLLEELKVDGFKTDGGEHLWGRDLRFADGRRGDELGNLYPNLYVGAYQRFAQEKRDGDALTFSRAGFTGAQAYPCHWAGDERSTWEAFRASILAGLNAGLSGLPFWGWDLAGFSGEIPTAELYLRAATMATFCPIMQYHSEFNEHRLPCRDRTPWNIAGRTGDPDVLPTYRFYANVRMNLLPYIYSEAWHSAQTGLPLMRAMWLEYPDDPACRDLGDQYFFGRVLLVAPVLAAGARHRQVYLPPGRWFGLRDQVAYEGATWIDCAAPQDVIPVFVREGAILPLNTGESPQLGSPIGNRMDRYENLIFRLYPKPGRVTCDWYDGLTSATYSFILEFCPPDTLRVQVPPLPHAYTLLVPGSGCQQVLLDDQVLPRVEHWATAAKGAWCQQGDGWVCARIPPAETPRRMLFTLGAWCLGAWCP